METEVTLAEVRTFRTSTGNTRYVGRDTDGNEYTTFREEIGERARQLEGSRVRIEYHQQERGRYRNVYLDGIQPAEAEGAADTDPADTDPANAHPAGTHPAGTDAADTDPEEAAWRTAVDAAPWLVGEPGEAVPPEKLYGKLKPFQQRVAEDIEEARQDRQEES